MSNSLWSVTAAVVCTFALPALADDVEIPVADDERRAWVAKLSKEQLADVVKQVPDEKLMALGKARLRTMNAYSARMVKRERIDDELHEPQTMQLFVQERPFAARVEVIAGPAKGRRLLYNSELKKSEFRVKEAGLFGIVGGVWVDINSSMARKDTNHPVTELGFGSLIKLIETDFVKGKAFGGHERLDEGFNAQGAYCMVYTAPPSATGLYADKTRICVDVAEALPVHVEVFDKKGLLETYSYSQVKPEKVGKEFFTLSAAKL